MPALNGVLGVLAFAIGVWVWMQARRRNASPVSQSDQPDYAQRFGLTEAQLLYYRTSQTCVVHHNEAGDIVGIDAAAPLVLVETPIIDTPMIPVLDSVAHDQASFATAA